MKSKRMVTVMSVLLVLKQAYPVGFSTGDATDFFGIVIARPPRAA
jgi:uncharacterized protein YlxP (DUF503 family)